MSSLYRPEFVAALVLFAKVSEAMAERGLPRPVLVGGAAVEFYSAGAMMTGDIDVCSPVQTELEEQLQRHGFVKPSGAGKLTRGWVHPDLGLGFEIVGAAPLDGNIDRSTLALVDMIDDDSAFTIISVEDLIADRMGQFASGTANDRLDQAKSLFMLHPNMDLEYLERRIREETMGDYGVEHL